MIRSSVVPQTMASETAQNANWNSHLASIVASERPRPLGKNACLRIAEALQHEPGGPDQVALARARAEREREADGVVGHRGDRQVDEDLGDSRADVLAAREADLEQREAGLHEQDEHRGEDHPHRVDRHGVAEYLVADGFQRVGGSHGRQRQYREQARAHHQRRAAPGTRACPGGKSSHWGQTLLLGATRCSAGQSAAERHSSISVPTGSTVGGQGSLATCRRFTTGVSPPGRVAPYAVAGAS